MVADEATAANRTLLDAEARLVDETEDLPPGAVLRCFSRAVPRARLAGCPTDRLPAEADRLARRLLVARRVRVGR